jgi:hypothetical protein
MTPSGFHNLLTLRRMGQRCPSYEAGASFEPRRVEPKRSIKFVKADAIFDPG